MHMSSLDLFLSCTELLVFVSSVENWDLGLLSQHENPPHWLQDWSTQRCLHADGAVQSEADPCYLWAGEPRGECVLIWVSWKRSRQPVLAVQGSALAKQVGAEAYLECSAFTSEKSIHSVFRTAAMACMNKLQALPKNSPTRRLSKRLLHLPSKTDLLSSTFKKEKTKSCSVMWVENLWVTVIVLPQAPRLFGLGEGGVGTALSGHPAESFPHPPRNRNPLSRGGHLAVHLLPNLLAHVCLFPLLFILLFWERISVEKLVFPPLKSMQVHRCCIPLSFYYLKGAFQFCPSWKCATWCDVNASQTIELIFFILNRKKYTYIEHENMQEPTKYSNPSRSDVGIWKGANHNESFCVTSCSRCLGGNDSRCRSCECRQFNLRGLLMHSCVALDSTGFFRGISGGDEEALCGGWGWGVGGESGHTKISSQASAVSPVPARGYLKTLVW